MMNKILNLYYISQLFNIIVDSTYSDNVFVRFLGLLFLMYFFKGLRVNQNV